MQFGRLFVKVLARSAKKQAVFCALQTASTPEFSTIGFKRVIGTGRNGVVWLAKDRRNHLYYAVKSVRGDTKNQQEVGILCETLKKEALLMGTIDSPFVIRFISLLQSGPSTYHLLTELCTGGDLLIALHKLGTRLELVDCQFYLAGTLLAVQSCHDQNIICRDIKLENILLDACGYPKHIDFSESRFIPPDGRCKTVVGTPQYLAPEVILGKGYGTSADVWSIGVLMHELVCGTLPFDLGDMEDPNQIFRQIIVGRLNISEGVSSSASGLLEVLLHKNPDKRCKRGIEGIKNHRFFDGFDWDGFRGREVEPPFVSPVELFVSDD